MPACDAPTVHVPEARNVMVEPLAAPLMEQTVPAPASRASVGARPDDAVAVTTYVPDGSGFDGAVEVIDVDCAACETVKT